MMKQRKGLILIMIYSKIFHLHNTIWQKINPAETDTFNCSVTNWDSMTHLSKSAEVQ